jgi:hypothetical protein
MQSVDNQVVYCQVCCILQKMSGVKVLIVSKVAADNAYEKKKH